MCVCVCLRGLAHYGERERERKGERETERQRGMCCGMWSRVSPRSPFSHPLPSSNPESINPTHTHTHTHTDTHTHTHTRIHRQTPTHTYTHIRIRIHTHTRTSTHTLAQAHTHIHTHSCTHIHTHTHSYAHRVCVDFFAQRCLFCGVCATYPLKEDNRQHALTHTDASGFSCHTHTEKTLPCSLSFHLSLSS